MCVTLYHRDIGDLPTCNLPGISETCAVKIFQTVYLLCNIWSACATDSIFSFKVKTCTSQVSMFSTHLSSDEIMTHLLKVFGWNVWNSWEKARCNVVYSIARLEGWKHAVVGCWRMDQTRVSNLAILGKTATARGKLVVLDVEGMDRGNGGGGEGR